MGVRAPRTHTVLLLAHHLAADADHLGLARGEVFLRAHSGKLLLVGDTFLFKNSF